MRAMHGRWAGLEPEVGRFMEFDAGDLGHRVAPWRNMLRFIGGYECPRWTEDRRRQPLKSRKSMQHFETTLRRVAVRRLRLEGWSFRRIGRELGISQVAAWKFWKQWQEDEITRIQAELDGTEQLLVALEHLDAGDPLPLGELTERVSAQFGRRAATRMLGSLKPLERS